MPQEPVPFSSCLEGVFENDLVGFAIVQGGRMVSCNACLARMLGREKCADLAGMAMPDLAAPGESEDIVQALVAPEGAAGEATGELYLQKHDGTPVACRYCCRPCPSREPGPPVLLFIIQDRTDYYNALDEYKKTMLDLEDAKLVQEENANMLSDMIVQLELAEKVKLEKERMQGILQLAIAAAHELSQPLQALQNDIYFLLESTPEGREEQQALDAMNAAIADMEAIISKIRKIASYKTTEYTKGLTMLDIDKSTLPEDTDKTD